MCLSYFVGIHSISFWYQFFCFFYSMWKLIATLRHMIKQMYGVMMQPPSFSHISRQGVMGLWCPLNIFYFIFGNRDLLNLPTKLGFCGVCWIWKAGFVVQALYILSNYTHNHIEINCFQIQIRQQKMLPCSHHLLGLL